MKTTKVENNQILFTNNLNSNFYLFEFKKMITLRGSNRHLIGQTQVLSFFSNTKNNLKIVELII